MSLVCTCTDTWAEKQIPPKYNNASLIHTDSCMRTIKFRLDGELRQKIAWANQPKPCTGPGFKHHPHGKCPGYTYDRI